MQPPFALSDRFFPLDSRMKRPDLRSLFLSVSYVQHLSFSVVEADIATRGVPTTEFNRGTESPELPEGKKRLKFFASKKSVM
jgi:hypothetical protein